MVNENNLRYVPRTMLGKIKDTRFHAEQQVVKVEAIPPSQRTEGDAPIVQGLTLVKVHLETGSIRYFGTELAYIDAHLRMVMEINPRDEVLRGWQRPRTESEKPGLIIEICPHEPRASLCLHDGRELSEAQEIADAVADCRKGGDCQEACEWVRDHIGVEFRIVARNAQGEYENRLATAEEKAETARAIYFDSESDFDDEQTAEVYLIWEAASQAEQEDE